jgi:hypothetical protein
MNDTAECYQRDEKAYLANGSGYLFLLCDVSRVEWDIVVALDDVKNGDNVASCSKLVDDMSAQETRAANNEVDVLHDRVSPTCKKLELQLT